MNTLKNSDSNKFKRFYSQSKKAAIPIAAFSEFNTYGPYLTENLYTVSCVYFSPGFKTALGKAG
jgi:hypothetical protein